MKDYSYWIMKLAIDCTGTDHCRLLPQVSSEEERDELIEETRYWKGQKGQPRYTELVIGDLPAVQVGSECILYTFVEVPFDKTFNVSYAPHLDQPIFILERSNIPFEGIYETPGEETLTGSESYDVLMMNPF